MINEALKVAGYFGVGFLEMFLATQRTYWISKGKSIAAALLVFFESLIAFWIIFQIVNNISENDFLIIAAYSAGNAIGTYINLEKFPF
jgi:hypothetical protein